LKVVAPFAFFAPLFCDTSVSEMELKFQTSIILLASTAENHVLNVRILKRCNFVANGIIKRNKNLLYFEVKLHLSQDPFNGLVLSLILI